MKKLNFFESIKKYRVAAMISVLAAVVTVSVSAMSYRTYSDNNNMLTRAEDERFKELVAMGYSDAVAADQCYEEFHNYNGLGGTGGIDGKLLDGSPAPGVPGDYGSGNQKPTNTPSTPAHAHNWEKTSEVASTCLKKGSATYTCTECGKTKTENYPIGEHEFEVIEELPATCTTPKHLTYKCSVCGELDYAEFGEKINHIYIPSNDSHEASCTEGGFFHYVCSVCGDEYTETTEPLGHDYSDSYTVDKKATCTEEGVKSIHCKRCDEIKEGSEVTLPMVEHVAEKKINAATTFESGLETEVCKNCGKVLSETVLPSWFELNKTLVIGVGAGAVAVVTLIVVGIVIAIKKRRK